MNILMPIFTCNPESVSEELIGYNWLNQISKYHRVFLITDKRFEPFLRTKINQNVIPHYVSVPKFGNYKIFSGFPPSYIFFLRKAYKISKEIISKTDIDIIHRVTPVGFRFFDNFSKFNLPYVLGPVAGGLKIPKTFKSISKMEDYFYLLRHFDKIRFKIDPFLINTFKKVDKILVAGDYLKDFFPSYLHHKMQTYCEASISVNKYKFSSNRKNNQINLLYVGRFVPYKSVHLLLRSIKLIALQQPGSNLILNLIGSGDYYYNYCKDLAKELEIESYVNFLGRKSLEEIMNYYQTSDIFCFPSIKEASGNVLLEAMSCGLPLIVADRGGPKEITTSRCAIKVPVINEDNFIENFKNAILKLMQNKEMRTNMGFHARQRVEKMYDIDNIGRNITNIYYDTINRYEKNEQKNSNHKSNY